MSDGKTEKKLLRYLRRVTLELDETSDRLREVEQREQEPIAIVGMSCRYPGGVSRLRSCGSSSPPGRRDQRFPTDRGWDWKGSMTPIPITRARATRATAAFSTMPPSLTRVSSQPA